MKRTYNRYALLNLISGDVLPNPLTHREVAEIIRGKHKYDRYVDGTATSVGLIVEAES